MIRAAIAIIAIVCLGLAALGVTTIGKGRVQISLGWAGLALLAFLLLSPA